MISLPQGLSNLPKVKELRKDRARIQTRPSFSTAIVYSIPPCLLDGVQIHLSSRPSAKCVPVAWSVPLPLNVQFTL